MAEVVEMRNNALPYPVYGLPWVLIFPIRDNDGDLVTGAAGLDSEVSKNGDSSTDCTNEAVEIGSTGIYYLILTGSEMTADVVSVITKTSTGDAKTASTCLTPRKLPSVYSGTTASGSGSTVTLPSATAADYDDAYTGMLLAVTIDGTLNVRLCTGYVGSTKVATVTPNFTANPDADDTFVIYATDMQTTKHSNLRSIKDSGYDANSFSLSVKCIITGHVISPVGSTSFGVVLDTGTPGYDDELKGQVICFPRTNLTTPNQKSVILASTAGGMVTIEALTDAVAPGDEFVIQ